MLFSKPISLLAIVTTLSFGAIYFFFVQSRSYDAPLYRQLIRESVELRSHHALERQPALQLREGVQKDIWVLDNEQRLHFRLNSRFSELTIRQKKDKVEALEELQQLECWLQEELDLKESTQLVRHLRAAQGTYNYPSHRFVAETVHLAFFRTSGIDLPKQIASKPYLTGVAKEASFAATGKFPTFTAYRLTATFDPDYTASNSRIDEWQEGPSNVSAGEHGASEAKKSEAKPTMPKSILESRAVYKLP